VGADYWSPHVHACGPPPQQDEWSCGYHLLRAWSLVFHARCSFTSQHLNEACAEMKKLTLAQLVQDACNQYKEDAVRLFACQLALCTLGQHSRSSLFD